MLRRAGSVSICFKGRSLVRPQVARVRGVVTEPAALESTALLLAHGLDLFHRRLAPSASYDMVPSDFPTALLVVVVVGMAAAAAALRALAARAALKRKWD